MIGLRRLVRRTSPGRGIKCRLWARVCSFDMNSPRSALLNAQVSTTCSPWVLITVTTCPAATIAALPRRAGISILFSLIANASGPIRDHVDFDNAAPREVGHADRRAPRAPVGIEMTGKDRIHRRVVPLEIREKDPQEH